MFNQFTTLSHSELVVVKDSDAVALVAGMYSACVNKRGVNANLWWPVCRSLLEQAQGSLDYRRTGCAEIAVVILPDFDIGFDSGAYEFGSVGCYVML